MTPVHVAAAWGRRNILNLLLRNGGDINIKDDENKIPMDYAETENHTEVINLLKKYNENTLQDTCNNDYDQTFQKIIINNGDFIAEYDVEKNENNSLNYINNYLNQLPTKELSSYVQNWCTQNMINEKFGVNCEIFENSDEEILKKNNLVSESKKESFFYNRNDLSNKKGELNKANDLQEKENEQSIILISDSSKNVTESSGLGIKSSNPCNESLQLVINKLNNLFLETKNKTETVACKDENNFTDFTKNILDASRESGLDTIPNDSSFFQNLLEPSNECKYIGPIELQASKTESSIYATCEDFSINSHEQNIFNASIMTSDLSNAIPNDKLNTTRTITKKIELNETYVTKGLPKVLCQVSNDIQNDLQTNIAVEYKYTDKKDRTVLIEKQYLVMPQIFNDNKSTSSKANTVASSLPTTIDYDTETLRTELTFRGEAPGPITSTTKRTYLKRLLRLQKIPAIDSPPVNTCNRGNTFLTYLIWFLSNEYFISRIILKIVYFWGVFKNSFM